MIELRGRLYGLTMAEARNRGTELTNQFDLSGLDQRLTKTPSGGQRRRLDIALGHIHHPKLVFLDEPTTGLDPQSRANLWKHIRQLRTEHEATVFLTTHYLDGADSLADRILVIDNGVIVAEGTQTRSSLEFPVTVSRSASTIVRYPMRCALWTRWPAGMTYPR